MTKSVLFIDDDETFLYVLERTAKKIENISDVYLAKNGKEALDMLKSWQGMGEKLPNVMFVDINMPVMDGFEFLERFKKQREELECLKRIVPVVMLTSSHHESDKEKALSTGVVEKYIIKPAGIEETEKMLKEVIA